MVIESFELTAPKTKELLQVMTGLGISGSALLVDEPVTREVALSARNLQKVKTTAGTAINIVDILKYRTVVMTAAAAGRVAEVLTP